MNALDKWSRGIALLVVVFVVGNALRAKRAQEAPAKVASPAPVAEAVVEERVEARSLPRSRRPPCPRRASWSSLPHGPRGDARALPRRSLGVAADLRVRAARQGVRRAGEGAVAGARRHAHRPRWRMDHAGPGDDRDRARRRRRGDDHRAAGGRGRHRRDRGRRSKSACACGRRSTTTRWRSRSRNRHRPCAQGGRMAQSADTAQGCADRRGLRWQHA